MKQLRVLFRFSFVLPLVLFISSCDKESFEADPVAEQGVVSQKSLVYDSEGNATCAPDTFTIFGGQTIEMGYLVVSNNSEDLYVSYEITNPDYYLAEAQLWIGTDLTLVPKANETPIPGQFPYKAEDLNTVFYQFSVPLADIVLGTTDYCDQELYVYAHGTVEPVPGSNATEGETTWSFGTPFDGTRWGWYSTYTVCCADVPPPVTYMSETAFAKFSKEDGGYVFTSGPKSNPEKYPSLDLTRNRWGWSGNLSTGSYSAEIWAGAGLNHTSKGVHIGSLYVDISAESVSVSYALKDGFMMEEVHIYVNDMMPSTFAPGQYGHTIYFDPKVSTFEATFDLSDTNGDGKFWLIAHAVVNLPL